MAEKTQAALATADEQLIRAKAKLDEMVAARDRAKAALEEIEQKRRGFARDFLLGAVRDAKATRAAANERNDAQNALEDMELMVDEAQSAVSHAQGLIFIKRFANHWEEVCELGARHADLLEKVITARDTMYAAVAEIAVVRPQIHAAAARARQLFPHGAAGANPSRVIDYVAGDSHTLANVIADTMPSDIFAGLPKDRGFTRPCTDALDKERTFWEAQKLRDLDAAPLGKVAA